MTCAAVRTALCLLAALSLAGCNTVRGQWSSVSIRIPEYDHAEKNELTFTADGKLASVWTYKDGETEVQHATYEAARGDMHITPRDGQPHKKWYRFKGGLLTIGDEQGHITYERVE